MWQGTVVDVCDTFCGDATFAATLVQMEQMDQSALEPPKQSLGVRDSVASNILDSMGRTVNHGSNTSLQEWGLETTLSPHLMHCQPVQARPYLISHWDFLRVILHVHPFSSIFHHNLPQLLPFRLPGFAVKMDQIRIDTDQQPVKQCDRCDPSHNHQLSFESLVHLQCQTFGNRSKPPVTKCKQKLV